MTITPPSDMPVEGDFDSAALWIAAIWSVLLEQHIDTDADFFDAGGDSLLALEAAMAVQAAGYPDLPISAVLRWPTPATFAANLR